MAKVKISEFNSNPALNTDIDSINLAEGCAPSGINDAIRELMAQLKDWQSGTSNDPYVVGSSGSLTLNQGTANGVAYLNGSKVVTSGSALVFDGTNLGVGIASPNTLLDVRGANGIGIRFLETSTGNTNRVQLGTGSGYGYIDATAGVGSTALAFQVGSTEQMRLTSTGLGIGTSSPTDKLHVVGLARINTGTYAAGYGLTFQANAETSRTYQMGMVTGGNFAIYDSSAAATRLTLDSSGNLGLGVTPSAWASGSRALQITPFASVSAQSNGAANFGFNFYEGGSNTFNYTTTDESCRFSALTTGGFGWYTAPSGTAGNAITFTQAMTLDASGNLGIGTTSPSSFTFAPQLVVGNGSASNNGVTIYSSSSGTGRLHFADGTTGTEQYDGYIVYRHGTPTMEFGVGGTERASIDSSGNLLVGDTTSGTVRLRVTNSASDDIAVFKNSNATPYGVNSVFSAASPNNTASYFYTAVDSGPTTRFKVYSNGGIANYSANNVNLSDQRVKTDIQDAGGYLAKICAIPVRTFKYKDQTDDLLNLGVIAQEVEAVAPELVDTTGFGETPEDGVPLKAIYQTDLQYALMKCIQELKAEFDAYKASHP